MRPFVHENGKRRIITVFSVNNIKQLEYVESVLILGYLKML